jgi:hypothetical protein
LNEAGLTLEARLSAWMNMTKQFCRSDLKDRSVPDFSRLAFSFRFRKSSSVHERSVAAAEIRYVVTIFCVRYSEKEIIIKNVDNQKK